MIHTDLRQEKIKQFLSILWPILLTQILMYSMNLIDTMMSGRAGVDDLAGVAIGSSLWAPILTGIAGILMALTAIVAEHVGAGRHEKVSNAVYQAMYIAASVAVLVIFLGILFLDSIITIMDLDVNVHHIAFHYLGGLSIGIIPLFLFNVIRNFVDAQGLTRVSLAVIAIALPINVILNYAFIFGHFGMPQLGGIGAGYATAITYFIQFFIIAWFANRIERLRVFKLFKVWKPPNISDMIYHLKIGVPIGVLIFVETSIFSFMTLLIGVMFSTEIIAANQIVLNFTTMLFMIPLSVSNVLTIVVAFSVGGERFNNAKEYTKIGLFLSLSILLFTISFIYLLREPISYLYTNDPAVVAISMQIFLFAMLFQLSDTMQAVFQGVLRGYKDVTIPSIIAIISYWGIGMAIGYFLASRTEFQVYGFWIGIIIGLTCAAVGFFIRLKIVEKNV